MAGVTVLHIANHRNKVVVACSRSKIVHRDIKADM